MFKDQVIKKVISTWKSEKQKNENNIYTFYVDPLANKFQLRNALETIFSVKIKKISSLREKSVLKNSRQKVWTKLRKKIFVKLKDGYKIGGEFDFEKQSLESITDNFSDNPSQKKSIDY